MLPNVKVVNCVCCRAERRKAAGQPEAVSADELKSLLVLARERFLGHFDALAPKAVLTQTDRMKSASMVNGKFFYSFKFWWWWWWCVCSIFIKFNKLYWPSQIYFTHLKNDMYFFNTCISELYLLKYDRLFC